MVITTSSSLLDLNANRIEHYFRTGHRGAMRIADIAEQLHVPIGYLYDQPMRERLERRGVQALKIPGVRYAFFYLDADGMPDTEALAREWSIVQRREQETDARNPGDPSGGRRQPIVDRVLAFLQANRGRQFLNGEIVKGAHIPENWLRTRGKNGTPTNVELLKTLGVTVTYHAVTPLKANQARNEKFKTRRAPTRLYSWTGE